MSRLRELQLHGFKTFADPTRFVFQPGVNAVIGPNGSGKSNMADAVRWVMGEQSNRSLRTRRADDVIFAGSEQRKPQGMAEAILTLDNEDGWLPIEFGEVSIGRRAYRNGESEYLINGARARLRDVTALLGEGRLGANELVVVGQGTVDAALSLRPEERRQLFEEAAGVKNLQVRKNEALARLGKASDNLTRVTDLIGELRPQVKRLALQAQHQQEHDVLVRRARTLVLESHRRRETAIRQALGDARRRAAAADAELEALRGQQSAARASVTAAEEAYWAAENAARVAGRAREETREARVRSEARLEALALRLEEVGASEERSEAALGDARRELEDRRSHGSADRADDEATPLLRAADEAERAWRAATEALAAADADLVAAEQRLSEERRSHSERIAADARAGEVEARASARREELRSELTASRETLSELEAGAAPAAQAAAAAEQAFTAATDAHQAALAALVDEQPRADAARRRASELAERVGGVRGELEALHDRADQGSRLGGLLTAAGWPSLLDTISAPQGAWPAIEAVVGGELEQALLWHDDSLRDRLAEARGSARLLIDDPLLDAPDGERREALGAVGGSRTLAEWVGTGAPALFRRVVIAPNLESLLAGWRKLPAGWTAVTEHGDLGDARGLVAVRGRGSAPEAEAARRHARRRELAEMLQHLEREQEEATTDAARLMASVSASARRLEAARAERDGAEREASAARGISNGLADRLNREVERSRRLEAELEALPQAAGADGRPRAGDDQELFSLEVPEGQAHEARAAQAAATAAATSARDAWQRARAESRQAEERQSASRQGSAVLEARIAQLAAEIASARQGGEQLTHQRDEASAAVDAARVEDERAAAAATAADEQREAARRALLELERASGDEVARLMELERTAQSAAIDASRHEEAMASLARERELALDSLPEEGQDDEAASATGGTAAADPVPDELAAEIGGMGDDAMDSELRRVRRTLAQIGSVNPFAVEEHRELSGRMEELSGQDADLNQAIGSTRELIARLDDEIGGQFNAAFAAIGERFDEFCRLLFAGGSASLHLGDGSDGEAPGGIEIVVRPPGKRLQRLAMLSGGERALTGVALLFAMLSVNPVPFCILDEVDAALDEANIGRFADALRKLSETTDFVVITHNRATIEVADTIYGVTMTDAAVSRTVSLRLADLPAEALVR